MNLIGTKRLETKRCILRRIEPDDYEMMYENWAKYEEVCRYFPFNPVEDINIYKDKVKQWSENYQSDSYFHWVIEWKENKELIGTINLGNVEESCLMSDTCYMLSPQYWGKGIMTEVLDAVLYYAFNNIELNRVQAEVFEGNEASAHVLKKCGMHFEGVARQKYFKNGSFIDAAQFAILRGDFKRKQ
jgi:ribosomal-protein-alanine N-acetyltransferase